MSAAASTVEIPRVIVGEGKASVREALIELERRLGRMGAARERDLARAILDAVEDGWEDTACSPQTGPSPT